MKYVLIILMLSFFVAQAKAFHFACKLDAINGEEVTKKILTSIKTTSEHSLLFEFIDPKELKSEVIAVYWSNDLIAQNTKYEFQAKSNANFFNYFNIDLNKETKTIDLHLNGHMYYLINCQL